MPAVRFKARRPEFRRGGLVLSDQAFVEADVDHLAPAQLSALLREPVVIVQYQDEDGSWQALTDEHREGLAAQLDEAKAQIAPELAATVQAIAAVVAPPPPSPPAQGAQATATPAGGGAAPNSPPSAGGNQPRPRRGRGSNQGS